MTTNLRRLAVLALLVPVALAGNAVRAAGADAPTLIVRWPRAALARWQDADGVPERRFVDLCRSHGWLLRPADLSPAEAAMLDRARDRAGDDLLWRAAAGSRSGLLVLGAGDATVHLRWEGTLPPGDPGRLQTESRAWLAAARRIRWEEVVEILDLTAGENRAFQAQRESGGPFSEVRSAFLRDKSGANLAIYLAGTRRPRALAWRLDLTEAFESTVAPLAEAVRADAEVGRGGSGSAGGISARHSDDPALGTARRRLFALRLLASRSRVYGRCDRILLSLSAESPRGSLLVVDARESEDPFVAVLRVDERLGPASERGDLLVGRVGEALRP